MGPHFLTEREHRALRPYGKSAERSRGLNGKGTRRSWQGRPFLAIDVSRHFPSGEVEGAISVFLDLPGLSLDLPVRSAQRGKKVKIAVAQVDLDRALEKNESGGSICSQMALNHSLDYRNVLSSRIPQAF